MDQTLKKTVACTVIVGVTLMCVEPMVECERRQLCEEKATELPHDHQREPAPAQTAARIVITASSTASFEQSFASRQSAPQSLWRKQ